MGPGYGGNGIMSAAVRLCLREGNKWDYDWISRVWGDFVAGRRCWTVARGVWAHLRGKRKKPENWPITYFYRAPPIETIFRKNP